MSSEGVVLPTVCHRPLLVQRGGPVG